MRAWERGFRAPAPPPEFRWVRAGERSREREGARSRESEGARSGLGSGTRYSETRHHQSFPGKSNLKETSFMFYNFPNSWDVAHMWRTFKNFGVVSDVYLARKKLRNGHSFGFVRFLHVHDVKEMLNRLRSIWNGSFKLRVFIAGSNRGNEAREKHEQWFNHKDAAPQQGFWNVNRDRRTYAEVLNGEGRSNMEEVVNKKREEDHNQTQETGIGSWDAEENELRYLDQCAIGNVTAMEHVEKVQLLFATTMEEGSEVKLLGGRNVLLKFGSHASMENVLANKIHGVHYWVKNLRKWSRGFRSSERLVWVRIEGVPLHVWRDDVFTKVAGEWGKVLFTKNCNFHGSINLMWGKVLVSTNLSGKIQAIRSLKVGNLVYVIKVEEEDRGFLELQIREEERSLASDESGDDDDDSSVPSEWSDEDGDGKDDWMGDEGIFTGEGGLHDEKRAGLSPEAADKDQERKEDQVTELDGEGFFAENCGDARVHKEREEENGPVANGRGSQSTDRTISEEAAEIRSCNNDHGDRNSYGGTRDNLSSEDSIESSAKSTVKKKKNTHGRGRQPTTGGTGKLSFQYLKKKGNGKRKTQVKLSSDIQDTETISEIKEFGKKIGVIWGDHEQRNAK